MQNIKVSDLLNFKWIISLFIDGIKHAPLDISVQLKKCSQH